MQEGPAQWCVRGPPVVPLGRGRDRPRSRREAECGGPCRSSDACSMSGATGRPRRTLSGHGDATYVGSDVRRCRGFHPCGCRRCGCRRCGCRRCGCRPCCRHHCGYRYGSHHYGCHPCGYRRYGCHSCGRHCCCHSCGHRPYGRHPCDHRCGYPYGRHPCDHRHHHGRHRHGRIYRHPSQYGARCWG